MSEQVLRTRSGTMVDELYLVLRERIIDGSFAPGQRMSQEQLAVELKVSRTPLREAFQRLERDGLLMANANRGMQVTSLDNSETEQHYALRLLVEPATLTALLDQITDQDVAQMAEALDAMTRQTERTREFQEAHLRFHDISLRHYPKAISDLTRSLHAMIYRHQRAYLSRPRVPGDFLKADGLLLDAIRRRDGALVHQLLEFHLIDAALGLILDLDPDHRFDPLLLILRGIGIDLDHDAMRRIERPARVRWNRDNTASMPALVSSNLLYEPESALG